MISSRKTSSLKTLAAVFSLALSLGACDSDSPTAPSVTTPSPPPSSGSASASWSITVAVDPPAVSITSILSGELATARVTVTARRSDGQLPVSGSTIVASTNGGTLTNLGQTATGTSIPLSFDAAGRAFATLDLPTQVGDYVIQAQLEQSFGRGTLRVSEEVFDTPLFIEAVTPSSGPPEGGTVVRIQGSGFSRPLRVQFGSLNANVLSSSGSVITVETPPITLPVGETSVVPVTVTININDPDPEQIQAADTLSNAFTYARGGQTDQPSIISLTPTSGPNEGGTLVTITGSNFASQVQVFFGTAALVEAAVTDVTPTRLLVETPSATGPNAINQNSIVNVRVINSATGLFAERAAAFQYGGPGSPALFISAAGPGAGPHLGGTIATIYGQGFDEPVAVSFGGVGQQVISVTGTEIVARSVPVDIDNCSPVSGPFGVTNIETGEGIVSGIVFQYIPVKPSIFRISPPEVRVGASGANSPDVVTILGDAFEPFAQVFFGDARVAIIAGSEVLDPDYPTFGFLSAFDVDVPTFTQEFETVPCDSGGMPGTRAVPTQVDVMVVNPGTDCFDTISFVYLPPSETCIADPVTGDPPVANFDFALNGTVASFVDLSTGSPTSWSWNFGDPGSGAANTSAMQNPTHDYMGAGSGTYNVTLTVTNQFGTSAPFAKQVTIP
jgi:IPT/TIG domain/PKD domain